MLALLVVDPECPNGNLDRSLRVGVSTASTSVRRTVRQLLSFWDFLMFALFAGHATTLYAMLAYHSAKPRVPVAEGPLRSRLLGQDERAMPLRAFLEGRVFDDDTTRAMGVAFQRACETLGLIDKTDPATRLLASKIIEAAEAGERDADALYETALRSLRTPPEPPRSRNAA